MTAVPVLHTARCTLSAMTQEDIPVLRQILDAADTQSFLPELCQEFPTAESLQQFITSFNAYLVQDNGVLWGIRKDETLTGFIAIMDIPNNPTLFYAMHPNHRNQGYMKECLARLMDYVHETKLCDILQTEVYKKNTASHRLLSLFGFEIIDTDASKYDYKKDISE